ncbi:aminotransferase class I/II-fold pyridoxal phosphate-dependent enzyme [Tissierella sp. Yu-01]|uniref:aminotransferase class I/II-fold pyridoxal phosphate-dependent enzyme n=1 Tax=Tissierella sp. Yu-01 TaxID=3035694 RepID=UPI00240D7666|nr:aminotransferase class I/II-fold pyridoxal phosphate-dependent enzyme [Tissierella sp. Yu-01]WFA08483.1 aminotransferase class I/II-fold pyridoxal phosphate-dependent enzyme [Tissierella sp. Yu-01]
MKTPVLEALKNLMEENSVSFHMPGHKGKNSLINWGEFIPYIDTTEVEGMDNLLEPRGIIQESQNYAANVFGAKATYYGVNGSTGSNYIALATITKPGDKILVQRNCHKSIYNGMVLNRLTPVYLYPEYNENYNLITGVHAEDIDRILTEQPDIKAVVLTYPNYYGVCSDLKTIADIIHKHNKVLMVDEAHGPHMTFSDKLPMSALEAGADIVIHSTHKTLPSFTQTSLLHVGSDRIDLNKLRDRYQLLTTTSPSYLFTLSNEISVAYMDSEEGRSKLEWNIKKAEEIIKRLNAIDRVEVFTGDPTDKTIFDKDVAKILISIDGIRGSQIKKRLLSEYNIRLEMSDYYYALAYISPMNTDEDYKKLVAAIEDMAKNSPYEEINFVNVKMPEPKIVMTPAEAYYNHKAQVKLKDAIGKVAAAPVIPYPPGVPLIHAGEEFTKEIYDHILFLMENGLEIVGLMGYNKDHIVVVE